MATSKKDISTEDLEEMFEGFKLRKNQMNMLIMNFLVTEGYVDAAEKFQLESNTDPRVDLATVTDRMAVKKAVQSGDVEYAIEKVNDMNPEILDRNPQLYFKLQQQQMIELIRNGKSEEALNFAREQLTPMVEKNQGFVEELQRTSLVFFEDARSCPFGDLLDISQRHKTANEVNAAILSSQSRGKDPELLRLFKTIRLVENEVKGKAAVRGQVL